MAKHTPRTIWRPVQLPHTDIIDTTAPVVVFFNQIRGVDADASMGLQLKHMRTNLTMGLTHTSTLSNAHMVSGHMGFFKWPIDAADPTLATMDVENRGKVWNRRSWVVQGDTVVRHSITSRSARLNLGEQIWFFLSKQQEADAGISINVAAFTQHWETQA